MDFNQLQEDDFLDFLTAHPTINIEGVPLSLVRLCFFAGYNAAVHQVEKILDEKSAKA